MEPVSWRALARALAPLLFVSALWAHCAFSTRVSAQAPDIPEADRLLARNHFERGNLLYDAGSYGEAAVEFEAAYALTQHVDLLYNVYTAQERAGALVEARAALERYLAEATIEQDRREALQVRLARLRERIAEAERERAEAAARLQAEREEREAVERARAAEQAAEAARRERERRRLRLEAEEFADMLMTAGGVGLVAGGLALANFAVFAGLSEAEDQALSSDCGRDAGGICHRDDVQSLAAYNTAADTSLAIGLSLAAAGAIAVVVAETGRPRSRSPGDTPRASLAPFVSSSGAGAAVRGVF